MKSIFESHTKNELLKRVNALQPDSQAGWGKMNVYQMLKHCSMSEEMFQGKKSYKRLFAGRLFGAMVLRGILKNDAPMKQNQPTHPDMKIKGSGNFENEKAKWIELLNGYGTYAGDSFLHPFFGKMTREEIGIFVFKHSDHHLRQFGK